MSLIASAVYRTPDGRRVRARCDVRRYQDELAWILAPVGEEEASTDTLTRDWLSGLLLVDDNKIYRLTFRDKPSVEDTGWTVADLVQEPG